MTINYKLQKANTPSGLTDIVIRTIGSEKTWIPFAEDNTDYQEYLEWVAEGNTAKEAD